MLLQALAGILDLSILALLHFTAGGSFREHDLAWYMQTAKPTQFFSSELCVSRAVIDWSVINPFTVEHKVVVARWSKKTYPLKTFACSSP